MAFIRQFFKPCQNMNQTRFITLCSRLQLKQIVEKQEGTTLIIQAQNIPSPRESFLFNTHNVVSEIQSPKPCAVCASGLDVKHTDVLILSQFVRSDGCMLPRRITGLCKKQQKRISSMVSMAQKAGLMSNLTPDNCKKDPKKRKDWKKFNIYFDESTIKC